MSDPLENALNELAARFEGRGWQATGRPTRVLAMTQHPSDGVEHTLFVTAPPLPGERPDPQALGLACTVNVHYPSLEDCINDALERDSADAGRQSLRLALARLAPAGHLFHGAVYRVRTDTPEGGRGLSQLHDDFFAFLEPVRRRLDTLDALATEPAPPTVDPWMWQMRRAAYLRLHAEPAAADAFLSALEAQAVLALAAGGSPPREAGEALRLAQALRGPKKRRVIRIAPRG